MKAVVVAFNRDIEKALARVQGARAVFVDPESPDTIEVPDGAAVELWVDNRNRARTRLILRWAEAAAREGIPVYLMRPPAPFRLWPRALAVLSAAEIEAARDAREQLCVDDKGRRRVGLAPAEGPIQDVAEDVEGSETATTTTAGDLLPPQDGEKPPDFFCIERHPGMPGRLCVQHYRDHSVVATEECALSALPLATQPTLANAPDLHVICDRGDVALIEASQSLQALSSVYFSFPDPSAAATDLVPATEVGAEPPNGGAGDADREGPNDDGYMAADPVKAMRYFADYFVTIEGGKAVVGIYARGRDGTEELKCETVGAMRAIFANWVIEGKPVFDMWFKSRERRTYLGFVFVPGAQRVVGRSLNLFTGFGCEPARGNCDLYWNHVRDVICGGVDEYFLYLQRWLAHMFQRPEELPEKAVVLLSKKEGVGKGTFIDPLAFLLRRHYITLTQSKHVTGPFNSHLRDKLLVFVNEALWTAGEPGIGILKSMITDRQTTHEGKGANASEGTNYARFVFASNWDLPVRIGPHDRRFLVLRVSDAHVGDHAYFEALRRQLDNGGRAALLYDLLNLDLADFNPRVSPKTQEGFTMKLRSAEASVRWWFDCLKAGAIAGIDDRWPATVGAAALYESYVRWCEGQGLRSQAPNVFGRELANMLAGTAFSPTRPGSAGNRTRGYALPTLPAARQAFERSVSEGPEIWNL